MTLVPSPGAVVAGDYIMVTTAWQALCREQTDAASPQLWSGDEKATLTVSHLVPACQSSSNFRATHRASLAVVLPHTVFLQSCVSVMKTGADASHLAFLTHYCCCDCVTWSVVCLQSHLLQLPVSALSEQRRGVQATRRATC